MHLFAKLQQRGQEGTPIKVGLIGGGKFGTMFLSQVTRLPGIHVVGIADLSPIAVRSNLELLGWSAELYDAANISVAADKGITYVTYDWHDLTKQPNIEIIIEATGNPLAAVEHCMGAFSQGKHVINVTVEADAFCGYGLALEA